MPNYTENKYQAPKDWIQSARANKFSWDDIENGKVINCLDITSFLNNMKMMAFWDTSLTTSDWEGLVKHMKEEEDRDKQRRNASTAAVIQNRNTQVNDVKIYTDRNSSWQKYKRRLLNKDYPKAVVDELEESVFNTLKFLSSDTTKIGSIKGMVVGSVQSGKTGHMAGLMAMAADNGWNMFIVLSGLLENLRLQTERRLKKDLEQGNNHWELIEKPGTAECKVRPGDFKFGQNENMRYFTVCLKNHTRLEQLITYLQSNKDKQEQMKILVIEDEADQAGVNACDADDLRLIAKLVEKLNIANNASSATTLLQDLVECTDDNQGLIYSNNLASLLPLKNGVDPNQFALDLYTLLMGHTSPGNRGTLCQSLDNRLNTKKSVADDLKKLASFRTSINELLVKLVANLDANGDIPKHNDGTPVLYRAMNYIAYTATPYANLLNEGPSDNSLFPRDFICSLQPSNEYFGPQQIFGYNTGNSTSFSGLSIVRQISDAEVDHVQELGTDYTLGIPSQMQQAFRWFFCCAACWRYWGKTEPISMLVHTNANTSHHENVAKAIEYWFSNLNRTAFINDCKMLWDTEKSMFTLKTFASQYPNYGNLANVQNYPEFADIETYFDDLYPLFSSTLNRLAFDNQGEPVCCAQGVNFCIDNSYNQSRIKYPDPAAHVTPAPAFIVVGGQTLSRGLTFEGLVCSYFARNVRQCDTLMQMGRWFGYRRGYELLPRIWLSDITKNNFEDLAEIDQDLRIEIKDMAAAGSLPSEVGVRIKNCPKLMMLTAKNKMQNAELVDMDFTGTKSQTVVFDNDKTILQANLKLTKEFLSKLGDTAKIVSPISTALVWQGIKNDCVCDFLKNFTTCKRSRAFNLKAQLIDWITKITLSGQISDWNIVLGGKGKVNQLTDQNAFVFPENSPRFAVGKIDRSWICDQGTKIVTIGTLVSPDDLLADVDLSKLSSSLVTKIKGASSGHKKLRADAGLSNVPQLLIYVVDKESSKNQGVPNAWDAVEDIVGIQVYIPGSSNTGGRAQALRINLS